ncbi:MAG: hypothetical protein AB7S48_10650 [Bacteroidales bacterium]
MKKIKLNKKVIAVLNPKEEAKILGGLELPETREIVYPEGEIALCNTNGCPPVTTGCTTGCTTTGCTTQCETITCLSIQNTVQYICEMVP